MNEWYLWPKTTYLTKKSHSVKVSWRERAPAPLADVCYTCTECTPVTCLSWLCYCRGLVNVMPYPLMCIHALSPRTEQSRSKYSGGHNITLDSADCLLAFSTRLQLCASFVIRFVFVVATTAKQKSDSESKKPTLRYVGVWINFTNFREVWVTVLLTSFQFQNINHKQCMFMVH